MIWELKTWNLATTIKKFFKSFTRHWFVYRIIMNWVKSRGFPGWYNRIQILNQTLIRQQNHYENQTRDINCSQASGKRQATFWTRLQYPRKPFSTVLYYINWDSSLNWPKCHFWPVLWKYMYTYTISQSWQDYFHSDMTDITFVFMTVEYLGFSLMAQRLPMFLQCFK